MSYNIKEGDKMLKSYRTIKGNGIHEVEIDKSRFICEMRRTEKEEDAQAFINEIKEKHADATHNCSAYQIGENNEIQRAHDNGEPTGTAGVPMLEILRKRDLKNVTAVVTRYFGGKLLGAGGLIRAYGGVVNETINKLGVVERRLLQEMHLTSGYSSSGKIENEIRQSPYILDDIKYLEEVTFICYVEMNQIEEFHSFAMNLTSGQGVVESRKQAYIEIDLEN